VVLGLKEAWVLHRAERLMNFIQAIHLVKFWCQKKLDGSRRSLVEIRSLTRTQ